MSKFIVGELPGCHPARGRRGYKLIDSAAARRMTAVLARPTMPRFIKILAMILLFTPILAYADVSISADVDKQAVALNDYLVYTVTVRGDSASLPEPKLGNLTGFKLYGSGTSQSVSYINGAVSMSVSHTYSLVPQTTGKFTIPPAVIEYKGNKYSTDPIDVEVTDFQSVKKVNPASGNAGGSGIRQRRQSPSSGVNRENGKEKVFVKASVSQKTAYVNEKITYRFGFYTNVNLLSNPAYQPPDFAGFFNDGTKPSNNDETIDGQNYRVSSLEYTLYPVESGKKTISAAKVSIAIADVPDTDDFNTLVSNMMAGMGIGQRQVNLQTDPITVNVLPLPQEGKPADFSGAVGNFKIRASADKVEAKTGDTVTVSVNVSGKGNMRSVNVVNLDLGNDFRKYDTITANASDGVKEFQTIIMPLTPGEKTIPKMRLSYFNPETKKYEFSESGEIKIKVTGNPILANETSTSALPVQVKNDIRYNKEIPNIEPYRGQLPASKKYYLMFAPFALLLAVSFFYRKRKDKIDADPVFKMKHESRVNLEKWLIKAQKSISGAACQGFYDNLYKALIEAANARTGTDCGTLNASETYQKLKLAEVSEETASKIKALFDKINFYKFASVKTDEKTMNAVLEEVKNAVKKLEK